MTGTLGIGKNYGHRIAFSGPMFDRQEIQGNKVILHFRFAESGLMVADKDGHADLQSQAAGKQVRT